MYELDLALNALNEKVELVIAHQMTEVNANQLGLDPRAGYKMFVNDEGIVISEDHDRNLQYYGGFEYVDKEYRRQYGSFVFYSAESSRVQECVEYSKESV